MPCIAAAGCPWNTVTFSASATCRAASFNPARSRSVAPRSASSTSARETLNSARSSTKGKTRRCAAVTPTDGAEIEMIRPK